MANFDAIVLGIGGVGSAALLEFARRGQRVLGLDRFGPAHDRGSSHGETRIIRQAYFEHPNYVPLAQAAYRWWSELEQTEVQHDQPPLYVPTGLLQIGPSSGHVLQGVRKSAELHGLAIEDLSGEEIAARWPGSYVVPADCEGVYEQNSGYLRVEACVLAQLSEALHLGAEARFDEPAVSWQAEASGVRVTTATDTYSADRLVIAAGAWANGILGDLHAKTGDNRPWPARLKVLRKPQYWFAPHDDRYSSDKHTPAVLFELPHGVFYAFPQIGELVKVAEHSGGKDVSDPGQLDCMLDASELNRVQDFCQANMPGITTLPQQQAFCMYTMTPDEHFVVDKHPDYPQVAFAAGLSGHGFKFTGVLGQALVDLLLDGKTDLPIGFLNCSRDGLNA